jgi:AbiV family abortive infection protein
VVAVGARVGWACVNRYHVPVFPLDSFAYHPSKARSLASTKRLNLTMKTKKPIISFGRLREGYVATLNNAIRFIGAAQELIKDYPDKSLALAQIGQEELGKSLTILCAFALPLDERAWKWFWADWNNHQVKSHRAYLYELTSPTRLEMGTPSGRVYDGRSLRSKISEEKELGFYVDFDMNLGRFVPPEEQISSEEAWNRWMALTYLSITADGVRRALFHDDEQFRLKAFGEIAYRICSEPIIQQDMPALVESFRKCSVRHDLLISDIETALAGNLEFLRNLQQSP